MNKATAEGQTWLRVPTWLARRSEIGASAKLVYGRLWQFHGKNGSAFPSYRRLAQEVGLSERQVINIVRELERMGLVKATRRSGRTNIFALPPHSWANGGENFSGVKRVAPGDAEDCTAGGEAGCTLKDQLKTSEEKNTHHTHNAQADRKSQALPAPNLSDATAEFKAQHPDWPNADSEAKRFLAHYSERDWQHHDGRPVKDWRRAVTMWTPKTIRQNTPATQAQPKPRWTEEAREWATWACNVAFRENVKRLTKTMLLRCQELIDQGRSFEDFKLICQWRAANYGPFIPQSPSALTDPDRFNRCLDEAKTWQILCNQRRTAHEHVAPLNGAFQREKMIQQVDGEPSGGNVEGKAGSG